MKESEKQGSISKPNKEIRFKDLRSKSFLERKIFLYPTFLSVVNPTISYCLNRSKLNNACLLSFKFMRGLKLALCKILKTNNRPACSIM